MCIAIVCFPGYDVIDFEINLIFLIEPFSYITRESTQKFIYFDNKKSDEAEIKTFIIFKGLSVANNCLREYTWRQWNYETSVGSVNNNQKYARHYFQKFLY